MHYKVILAVLLFNFTNLFVFLFGENISKAENIDMTIAKDNIKEEQNTSVIYPGFRTVAEVVHLIESKAIRRVDFKKFIEESLKAAVPYCDAHSSFFSKKAYKETLDATSGKFSGIGVSILSKLPEDDGLEIIDVIDGGPAQKAGCHAGDEIIEVNGEKLKGLSSDEVVYKLKGNAGTKANVKVLRNKKILEFSITRDFVKNEVVVSYFMPKQNIFYVSLRLFSENATKSISDILAKASKQNAKGIIIDIRRNPGGILDIVIDIAGLFLDNNSTVVYTKNRDGKIETSYKTATNPIFNSSVPIFFLIDNFTASASEILAGALRYYSENNVKNSQKKLMVFLVGSSTFGKGSVQEVIPISNGCALKLTTMLYYLPNNESIQAVGISPDFVVKHKIHPDEDLRMIKDLYGTETSIKHHITRDEVAQIDGRKVAEHKAADQVKKSEDAQKKSWEEKSKEALAEDQVVQAAINLINLLSVAKQCSPDLVATRQKAFEFLRNNFVCDEGLQFEKL